MWPLLTGLVTGGASLLGSIFSSNTSAENTQAQIAGQQQMQQQSETFNAAEAQKTRDYQTQMSNTAFQRSRADAQAAGLNPMVLAGMGGASTPSGATASIGTPTMPTPQRTSPFANLGETVSKAVSTAVQAKTMDKMTDEIANLQATRGLTTAETDATRRRAGLISAETGLTSQKTSTEKEETFKREQENTAIGLSMPGRRFSAKQGEDLLSMPDWMRRAVEQGAYTGHGISKAVEPISELAHGAKDISSTFKDRYGNF